MISLVKESRYLGFPYEACCFCNKGTQFWSTYKDVPICRRCARYKQEYEVPTKEDWCKRGSKTRNHFSAKDNSSS